MADDAGGQPLLASRTGRTALAATILAGAMAMLDGTIVNVALPTIGEDLDTDVSGLQWVSSAYLVTLASLILLGGALGDRLGRRRVFVLGIVWFAVASIGCAAAPTVGVLVVARLLQGVGGALVAPGSLALIQASFTPGDRGAAVGYWSALGGVAGALGPFLGGWIVQGPGWRWAFLINVPVAAVTLVATRSVPESRDPNASGRFDVAGTVLAVVALGTGTWALISGGERGWADPLVVTTGVVAVLAGVSFVVRQRRADHPLVPPSLFRSRTFSVLNVATFVLYAAIGSLFFLVVYQLQVSAGWSPLAAGAALVPATILMLVGSPASGRLATRIGPRPQLIVGPLLAAGGFVLLASIGPDPTWLTNVLPGAVLVGLGLVTFVAPLTASVMGAVDAHLVGTASAVNNAVARTASLAAVAVLPVVSGLSSAEGAAAETTDAYRVAMILSAVLAGAASIIAAVGLPRLCATRRSPRAAYCCIDATPAQPSEAAWV